MSLLKKHPEAGLCFAPFQCINEHNEFIERRTPKIPELELGYYSPQDCFQLIKDEVLMIPGATSIIKRDVLLKMGGWPESLLWKCDWFRLYAIAFRHGVCFIPYYGAFMRLVSDSFSSKGENNKSLRKRVFKEVVSMLLLKGNKDLRKFFSRSGILNTMKESRYCFSLLLHPLTVEIFLRIYVKNFTKIKSKLQRHLKKYKSKFLDLVSE